MLLINPAQERFGGFLSRYVPVGIPVGIGYIISYLEKQGITCQVLDEEISPVTIDAVFAKLAGMPKPHMVGIGCLTAHVGRAYDIARMIKRADPEIIVIVGGLHPTALPNEPLDTGAIDYVVRGEGEEVTYQLYRAVHGDGEPTDIRGVSYRGDDGNVHNPEAPLFPDLDAIPPFPYHLFDHPRYDMGFLTTSRGCPYRCSFCSQRMMTGTTYRYKSAKATVDELEILVDKYGRDNVVLYDDNFCIKKKRVLELCDEIIARGLHKKVGLAVQTRADNFVIQGGDAVVKRMAEAGFVHASFGLETGVQRLADLTMKDETIEVHIEAVKLCKKYGLGVSLGMIYGLPTETSADRKAGFDLVSGLGVVATKFNNLIPYPGTPLYTDLINSGRMNILGEWENFNSTMAITRSVFDKTPLPYVPETCSEWELKREIIYYNLRSYVTFKSIMNILDHTRGMAWVSLPKRWYLRPKELWGVTKAGVMVMTNIMWSSLPLAITEPIMNFLNPNLKKRPRVAEYNASNHVVSDWDEGIPRRKAVMLRAARHQIEETGALDITVTTTPTEYRQQAS